MKKSILLIRHGKTKGNMEGRYIGLKTDEALCEEGKQALYKIKKDYQICDNDRQIYSSPMKRAIETADILFNECDVTIITNLKEIDFGDFENKNYQDLNGNKDYQSWIDSGGKSDYPGGEKLDVFIKRSMAGFDEIISQMGNKGISNAAVVCHGGNIMAIMSCLTGKDYFDFQVKNGHGYKIDIEVKETEVDLISYSLI